MISKEILDKEILELERHDTTYATCAKLADLYIVRNNLLQEERNNERISIIGESEFIRVINDLPINSVLKVLNEHMSVVQAIMPNEYSALINKFKCI